MDDSLINPEDELNKVEAGITKYRTLVKTARSHMEKKKYEDKLTELLLYKKRILDTFDLKIKESFPQETEEGKNFLDFIMDYSSKTFSPDNELNDLCNYLEFFDTEFLGIFSERKLRLDFKHSLDRDNFHHKFQELRRSLNDIIAEQERISSGNYYKDMNQDIRRRHLQVKRNLFIDTNKFVRKVARFTTELLHDLNGNGLICLNGSDIIHFELTRETRYLEGITVKEAIEKIHIFAGEVIDFLNLPDTEA